MTFSYWHWLLFSFFDRIQLIQNCYCIAQLFDVMLIKASLCLKGSAIICSAIICVQCVQVLWSIKVNRQLHLSRSLFPFFRSFFLSFSVCLSSFLITPRAIRFNLMAVFFEFLTFSLFCLFGLVLIGFAIHSNETKRFQQMQNECTQYCICIMSYFPFDVSLTIV